MQAGFEWSNKKSHCAVVSGQSKEYLHHCGVEGWHDLLPANHIIDFCLWLLMVLSSLLRKTNFRKHALYLLESSSRAPFFIIRCFQRTSPHCTIIAILPNLHHVIHLMYTYFCVTNIGIPTKDLVLLYIIFLLLWLVHPCFRNNWKPHPPHPFTLL